MPKIALGRVRPTYQGDWDSTRPYVTLDRVTYNTVLWEAIEDIPARSPAPEKGSASWWPISVEDADAIDFTPLYDAINLKANDTSVVHLEGDETIHGLKAFHDFVTGKTAPSNDNSDNLATTAYVQNVLAGWQTEELDLTSIVSVAGNQTITGLKTYIQSPLVPTEKEGDISQRTANTAFVHRAFDKLREQLDNLNATDENAVHKTDDEIVNGIKTFVQSPLVPTVEPANVSQDAASTEFVHNLKWVAYVDRIEGDEVPPELESSPDDALVITPDGEPERIKYLTPEEADDTYARKNDIPKNAVTTNTDQMVWGSKEFQISPTAPTPEKDDNSTKIATTEYVDRVSWVKYIKAMPEDTTELLQTMPVNGLIVTDEAHPVKNEATA